LLLSEKNDGELHAKHFALFHPNATFLALFHGLAAEGIGDEDAIVAVMRRKLAGSGMVLAPTRMPAVVPE
jgi:hypothetical protein